VSVGIKEIMEGNEVRRVWEVADYAAGFHRGMARVGHVGNTVMSGHNNIRGEVFRDLYKLQPGDDIYVWVGDVPYRYQVSVKYRIPIKGAPPEVLQDNLRWILPTDDQRLTLLTCWPNWSNTHRIIVIAFPVRWET
jgi:sortase A